MVFTHLLLSLRPIRQNSFPSAASVVISAPERTPACFRDAPVAYRFMFTVPDLHWVTFSRILPIPSASRRISRNQSLEMALPLP